MNLEMTPWIELSPPPRAAGGNRPPERAALAWRAQVALRVWPRPFPEREAHKWGWNAGALLDEALDRQRLFLAGLHPRSLHALGAPGAYTRSVCLRCVARPAVGSLSLAVLGAVSAEDEASARRLAQDFARELAALLPYDYGVSLASTAEQFRRAAGWDVLADCAHPGGISEIGREESALASPEGRMPLLGQWQWSRFANEHIWRALSASPTPLLWSVYLQPTLAAEAELKQWARLQEMARQAAKQAEGVGSAAPVVMEAERALELYRAHRQSLSSPYLLQVHLASSQVVPEFIERAVGNALTFTEGPNTAGPGYSLYRSSDPACLEAWRSGMLRLEPAALLPGNGNGYQRLRLLAGLREASAVFRLPFPHNPGWPGVRFEQTNDA